MKRRTLLWLALGVCATLLPSAYYLWLRAFRPVHRAALVAAVQGEVALRPGARCRLRIVPELASTRFNCRVEVRCGATKIYGSRPTNGFLWCSVADGEVVRVRDGRTTAEGGDPRLDLDVRARRLVVSDAAPDFRVRLTLP